MLLWIDNVRFKLKYIFHIFLYVYTYQITFSALSVMHAVLTNIIVILNVACFIRKIQKWFEETIY